MTCLFTWYGITDIKSAMGFEFQGPILGALKTGEFDEVHILAYTRKREFSEEELFLQNNAVRDLNDFQGDKSSLSREESLEYVDILANTSRGHQFYVDWLKKQLAKLDLSVNVALHECFLSELNDSEGIYFSVVEALTTASSTQNKEIVFFLSPGTPVMAFSWALAMLAFPNHNIKLLVSSDFRRGMNSITISESVVNHVKLGLRNLI